MFESRGKLTRSALFSLNPQARKQVFKLLFAFAGASLLFMLGLGLPAIAGLAALSWGHGVFTFEMLGPTFVILAYLTLMIM